MSRESNSISVMQAHKHRFGIIFTPKTLFFILRKIRKIKHL
jgi:hypothetical protein